MDFPAEWCTITHCENTMNYLKRENVSFIKPQMWPPNSPVDYAVWDAL